MERERTETERKRPIIYGDRNMRKGEVKTQRRRRRPRGRVDLVEGVTPGLVLGLQAELY